ncbi:MULTISPECIES: FeoA family protein [Alphaproteobacteria]|uniref:Iron transporter FeoA n=2 Tax=Alphaproteobacteria TaxID=28211 RepID=A0A512HG20_9HYPH|nr:MULTISPECIES: FeoA family protein [Alphaproteobacteria]GEO84403.1 iron transporter FeoA [Ciceribacter naphthalenivorans]GLR22366.1 iron transporter FeoA [Ciceribacter naphthalenivorans]GLT05222.1 iron transporter FeoA [Sphingomonas psychrolutea]
MPLLNELPVGAVARVTGYSDRNAPCRRRLLSMGVTPGAVITVTRRAPLGDPIELNLRGTALCLRLEEARVITVEPIIATVSD